MASRIPAALATLAVLLLCVSLPLSADAHNHKRKYNGRVVTRNLVGAVSAAKNFSTFLNVLRLTGLDKELPDLFDHYDATIFAPTDAAFAAVPKATLSALLKNVPLLREIVLLHIVKGKKLAAKIVSQGRGHEYETAAGMGEAELVKVSARGSGRVQVRPEDGGATVSVHTPNAVVLRTVVVHSVASVIVPKSPKKARKQLTLKQCFDAAEFD
ncbi:unnamed protein product [Closterium sp. Naga37s-1]|nr:unnamed protein product [Closterium sp. Naga37s-1]